MDPRTTNRSGQTARDIAVALNLADIVVQLDMALAEHAGGASGPHLLFPKADIADVGQASLSFGRSSSSHQVGAAGGGGGGGERTPPDGSW